MDPEVDEYIGASTQWPAEMAALRPILLAAGLDEQIKWRKPCYSHEGKNIVIMQEMKAYLALMFFKGALIEDLDGVLHDQGPNSRSVRRMQFGSVADVEQLQETIAFYIAQAIEIEQSGATIGPAPAPVFADELRQRLDEDPLFRAGFESLTPGRQREYNLFVSGAKQAKTRVSRVEKYASKIIAGKGMRER